MEWVLVNQSKIREAFRAMRPEAPALLGEPAFVHAALPAGLGHVAKDFCKLQDRRMLPRDLLVCVHGPCPAKTLP